MQDCCVQGELVRLLAPSAQAQHCAEAVLVAVEVEAADHGIERQAYGTLVV